jgi:hypothetical protein
VLDVDRGVNVDAGIEQLLDVEPALGVPTAGCVRVRELVRQDQLGSALEDVSDPSRGALAAVRHDLSRDDLQPVEQSLRLGTAVRLGDADHHVDPSRRRSRAAWSMAYVLPTPGAARRRRSLRRLRCS